MGPERLSKIMTCGKYFENFRSTFTEQNSSSRHRSINKAQTSEEKEFGKLFHNLIQCYVINIDTTNLEEYLSELIHCQSNEKWTPRLIELLSPFYDHKTADSYLNAGDSESMERHINRFSEIYHKYNFNQFKWNSEVNIPDFQFSGFTLNGDIDLVGINIEQKKVFIVELKKAQEPYPQWKFQLYLYMLMVNKAYEGYQIFGAIWHPGARLKVLKLDLALTELRAALVDEDTNPVRYICDDCVVWGCDDRMS